MCHGGTRMMLVDTMLARQHGPQEAFGVMEKMPQGRNYQCVTCLKCFSAPSKLQRHILSHTGQRPFGCHLCEKAFRQLAHLKLHLNTHLYPKRTEQKKMNRFKKQHTEEEPIRNHDDWSEPEKQTLDEDRSSRDETVDKHTKIIENSNSHKCPECFKCFSAPSKLKRHCLIHTGQKPFQCYLCRRAFRQLAHLKVHYSIHSGVAKSRSLKSFSQPQRSKTWPRNYPCNICGRRFKQKRHLIVHQQTHQDRNNKSSVSNRSDRTNTGKVRENQCMLCLKKFDYPSKLSRHLLVHMDIKPFGCTVCSKSFRQLCHLQNHMKAQHVKSDNVLKSVEDAPDQPGVILLKDKGRYSCPICSKRFDAPSKLQRHSLIHTGQRSYQCPTCLKTFRQKAHLKVHQSVHEQRKEAKPSTSHIFCNRSQKTSRDSDLSAVPQSDCPLTNNVNSPPPPSVAHRKLGGYQCMACLKKFDYPSKLSRHLLVHMGIKPFRCAVCSKSFRQLCHLQSHMKVHNSKTTLHEEERQASSYRCAICFKSFEAPSKLKRHYVIHTGQRPFQCTVCGKAFTQAGHLKTHLQIHR
ncbi:unnamed protein product [Oncorhynchus mykiss]|uniref:C2H2-type domain-containing protein n=1 Tax=Oncorhynchus mykiss TaxID=8022 RepID=A0A060XXN3_ONCMY|nr:unnamed protein product [Oncorhynchus mykiss]